MRQPRIKIVIIIETALLAIMTVIFSVLFFSRDNSSVITGEQAQSIAYGNALYSCLNTDSQNIPCKDLKVFNASENTPGVTDSGPKFWTFDFSAGTEPNAFNTRVYINSSGIIMTQEQAQDSSR